MELSVPNFTVAYVLNVILRVCRLHVEMSLTCLPRSVQNGGPFCWRPWLAGVRSVW